MNGLKLKLKSHLSPEEEKGTQIEQISYDCKRRGMPQARIINHKQSVQSVFLPLHLKNITL
jgi:hypothetical protein